MELMKKVEVKKEEVKKEKQYKGEFRILNSKASPIEKTIDNVYKPKNQDEIECLEYQVKQGRVFCF